MRAALALAWAGLLGCAAAAPPPPPEPLHVPEPRPVALQPKLEGRIWDSAARKFVTRAELEARLVAADFVLLGEKHDNPEHHRLQAEMLRAIVAAKRRPIVAFEMLEIDEQPAVDAARAAHPGDAQAIARAVAWEKKGWPPFADYEPIVLVALGADLPIVAANLPRKETRALVKEGLGALDPEAVVRLGLDVPLPPALAASLRDEMREAHCGHLPESMLDPMALAQRARDAEMAERMRLAANGQGAVLIAGAGHARTDRGVPRALRMKQPAAKIVSLAWAETEPGQDDVAAYGPRWNVAAPPFDFVWFTNKVDTGDPCEKLRKAKRD